MLHQKYEPILIAMVCLKCTGATVTVETFRTVSRINIVRQREESHARFHRQDVLHNMYSELWLLKLNQTIDQCLVLILSPPSTLCDLTLMYPMLFHTRTQKLRIAVTAVPCIRSFISSLLLIVSYVFLIHSKHLPLPPSRIDQLTTVTPTFRGDHPSKY